MSAYLEGRTTRLSSTETSRSRSSQEDFLCSEPPVTAAEPQYHPGPLGGGTTHSGRKPLGSSSSDVPYRCDPVEVIVTVVDEKMFFSKRGILFFKYYIFGEKKADLCCCFISLRFFLKAPH